MPKGAFPPRSAFSFITPYGEQHPCGELSLIKKEFTFCLYSLSLEYFCPLPFSWFYIPLSVAVLVLWAGFVLCLWAFSLPLCLFL